MLHSTLFSILALSNVHEPQAAPDGACETWFERAASVASAQDYVLDLRDTPGKSGLAGRSKRGSRLDRLCALVPPPHVHTTRYFGVFANRHQLRARILPPSRVPAPGQQLPLDLDLAANDGDDLDTNTTALMVERSLEPSSDADVVIRTAAEATAASLCCDPATEPGKHGNPFCFEGHRCCADGQWACNEGNGSSTCFGGEGEVCEEHHPPPNPDLTIKSVWLELPGSLAHVNTVQQGHAYLACFVVANIGSAASGAFRVSGGGLGIPTNPYQDHAGLVPGASRQGCLFYPTTPGPGFYKLGIGADSQHVVNESREDNNDAILPIKVAS